MPALTVPPCIGEPRMYKFPRLIVLTLIAATCFACGSPAASQAADASIGEDAVADVAQAADADAVSSTDTGDSPDAVPSPFPATLTDAIVTATHTTLADDPTHGLTLTIDVPSIGRWSQGIGFADADNKVPMDGLDRLRVGSITKTFVTAAVLRDVEAGKVSLNDSAATLLPDITIDPAITVSMLLGHRSGIFNFTDDGNILAQATEPILPEALYALAAKHPPEFAPGTGYSYSNTNFIVLGLLLQKLHGVALHTWLRQTLWTPLQLKDTWLEGFEDVGLQHVPGYLAGTPAPAYDTSWAWAAGAVVANGSDLCTWLRALYVDGAVVSPDSIAAMITPSPESLKEGAAYGLGTMTSHRNGHTIVGHTGSTMGFNAEVFIERDSGICVAVLTNDFFGVRKQIGQKVWEVLLGGL
jgi:D-alanyl-D-alanine carboxypeptidase